MIQKAIAPSFFADLTACTESVAKPSAAGWRASCGRLGDVLLPELMTALGGGVHDLILVADEKLAFLPFEALSRASAPDLLIDRFNIHYLPAASLLDTQHRNRVPASRWPWGRSLLAFGDPRVDKAGREAKTGFDFAQGMPRLAHSVEEVAGLARELTGAKQIHVGQDALKKYIFGRGTDSFPILHLSTHAAIDAENPQRSYVVFSPEQESAGADYLFLGEVFSLDLRGVQLVTLSACETSRGKTIRGEGVQDFSRAFLQTGAQATVSTLWRVADQPTSEFMKQFYYFLSLGESKAAALRRAKLKFIHSGSVLAHPYYWAAFVLNGDGESSLALPLSWTAVVSVLMVGFGSMGCVLHWISRRRRAAIST